MLWSAFFYLGLALVIAAFIAPKLLFRVGYKLYADTPLGQWLHQRSIHATLAAAASARPHSTAYCTDLRGFRVVALPCLRDNYAFLLIDAVTREAAAVDPCDPYVVLHAVQEHQCTLTHVLTTHKHPDHSGGNVRLLQELRGLQVVGGHADKVPGVTRAVGTGDTINVGELVVKVVSTPCHTRGHVCYVVHPNMAAGDEFPVANPRPDPRPERQDLVARGRRAQDNAMAIFTGDCLFTGGAGAFFEGTAEQMYDNLSRLSAFPDTALVFCGHEYTTSNLGFASFIEPDNRAVVQRLRWAREQEKQHVTTVPSTLGEEKRTNPFMRVDVLAQQAHLQSFFPDVPGQQGPAPVAVMAKIRQLKSDGVHLKSVLEAEERDEREREQGGSAVSMKAD